MHEEPFADLARNVAQALGIGSVFYDAAQQALVFSRARLSASEYSPLAGQPAALMAYIVGRLIFEETNISVETASYGALLKVTGSSSYDPVVICSRGPAILRHAETLRLAMQSGENIRTITRDYQEFVARQSERTKGRDLTASANQTDCSGGPWSSRAVPSRPPTKDR